MNETNNTNGGPGTEAKAPHVLDFNGTEIRPGLWAIEADELQRVGNTAYQAGRMERAGEVDQLREALKTASQDQASVAAALRCEPGERVEDTVRAVAGILRKTCAVLGIHDEDATDIPGMVSKLCALRSEVVKAFGEGADEHFGVVHARRIDDEVERATRRIDAARSRAVTTLDLERSEYEARRQIAVAEAETRTRKACADQINAAQACIDRATKEHEAERVKLYARIAQAEKQRDSAREAHAQAVDDLESQRGVARLLRSDLREIETLVSFAKKETIVDAVRRMVAERTNTVTTLRNCREKLAREREARQELNFHVRTITLANHDEATLDAVQRVVAERDDAVGRAALRAIPLRSVDIFGRDGIKIGDIVCMPDGTFAVGP